MSADAPPTMGAGDLEWRICSLGPWHHRIELPGPVVTPGASPIAPVPMYRLPDDLAGSRVLDACARDGYWTFEALRRGAREVVAIGDTGGMSAPSAARPAYDWRRFDFCRSVLGYDVTRCRRVEGGVYDVSAERLGRFDVVLFFDALHRLRYPLLALDRLAAVCDDALYVEAAVADFHSPYRGGLGRGYDGEMVMEFYPEREYGGDPDIRWAPTLRCLAAMMSATGFRQVRAWRATRMAPDRVDLCRGFACGVRADR